jgi:2-octaprenyl-6-methoxyphenol hydroxylase
LLIAADGASSTLREEQGISVNTKNYNHFAVLTNVKLEASHPFRAYERFLAQGAIALLPWQNNLATCVWTTQHEQAQFLLSLTDEEFIAACQAEFGFRMGKITQVGKRNCFPLQMTIASVQSSARFLVMGNAAHSLHPIAAQGLNLSLRDIWQVRNQALHLNNKADLGSEDFIAEYHQARSHDQNRIIFATDKIARFMSGGPLPSWLRACGITLFDCVNPLKQLFTRFSMGLS